MWTWYQDYFGLRFPEDEPEIKAYAGRSTGESNPHGQGQR